MHAAACPLCVGDVICLAITSGLSDSSECYQSIIQLSRFLAATVHAQRAVRKFGIKTDTDWEKSAGGGGNRGMSQTLVATPA